MADPQGTLIPEESNRTGMTRKQTFILAEWLKTNRASLNGKSLKAIHEQWSKSEGTFTITTDIVRRVILDMPDGHAPSYAGKKKIGMSRFSVLEARVSDLEAKFKAWTNAK